ncbi:MAG: HAMP domain-containing protein [Lachnospiraceae bacterium]|nr:HAMP domain-containing protein [Lachnospiraceae bacterium]
MVTTYNSCNRLFNDNTPEGFEVDDLYGKIKNPAGAIVLIIDVDNNKIYYTSINDDGKMMQSLYWIIHSVIEAEEGKDLKNSEYIIQRNHDDTINSDYYDLVGKLDNGFSVIIRSPISEVESFVDTVKRVFNYIAAVLIIFSAVFVLFLSSIFTTPIKKLSHSARRMANLDFDSKVKVYTKDEIGELGECMNELSSKLEDTISQLKTANIELEKDIEEKRKIDDMRKEFLSHISHELKTPIALIQGYAEGLKDNLFDDKENMEFYSDVIIDESKKMNQLVQKLITLNEIEFGNFNIKIERFDVVELISGVLNSTKILTNEGNVRIQFEEKEPVYVWADEFMIEEAFTNYLTNAIHYVSEGGLIRIFLERKEDSIRLCVYNQGNQIADEDIDKLFIKFYKSDKSRSREYGGNGIGLSIVAATMQAHGKEYGVYNVEDGVVFYFDLDVNMPC